MSRLMLSVDVEALPSRAESNHIDKLIYGKFGSKEHGIRTLCRIFDEYNIRAVFMLDFAIIKLYGEMVAEQICNNIMNCGHEVQIHFHPELYFEKKMYFFDKIGFNESLDAISYAVENYIKICKRDPIAFRAGGLNFNKQTILAIEKAGLLFSTNLTTDHKIHREVISDYEEFKNIGIVRWSNGIFEAPIDIALPELSTANIDIVVEYTAKRISEKKAAGCDFFHTFLHSWSLLERDNRGYNYKYNSDYETNLRKILEKINSFGSSTVFSEIVDDIDAESTKKIINVDQIKDVFLNEYSYSLAIPCSLSKHCFATPSFYHNLGFIFNKENEASVKFIDNKYNKLTIFVQIQGGPTLSINRFLVSLDVEAQNFDFDVHGFKRSDDADIGFFKYINTGGGLKTTKIEVTLPVSCPNFVLKFKKWFPNDDLEIKTCLIQLSNNERSYPRQIIYQEQAGVPPLYLKYSEVSDMKLSPEFRSEMSSIDYRYMFSEKAIFYGILYTNYCNFPFVIEHNLIKLFAKYEQIDVLALEKIRNIFLDVFDWCVSIEVNNFYSDSIEFAVGTTVLSHTTPYLLHLPSDLSDYKRSLSKKLIYDLSRETRRLQEEFPSINYTILESGDLTPQILFSAANVVAEHHVTKNRLSDKSQLKWNPIVSCNLNLDNYLNNGLVCLVKIKESIVATQILLIDRNCAHLVTSGYVDGLTKYSMSKILFFVLIEYLIKNKFQYLHLGRGDFGYKSRFGALLKNLISVELRRYK